MSINTLENETAATAGHGSSLARVLYMVLLIVAVFLGVMVAAFIGLAIAIMIPSGFRAELLMEYVAQGGLNVGGYGALSTAFLGGAIICAGYLSVVLILRKVSRTLLAGDPFVPENISRLRLIWIIIAATECVRIGMSVVTGELEIRLGTWFLVFVIAAMSEVFAHGAELRRDAELTV